MVEDQAETHERMKTAKPKIPNQVSTKPSQRQKCSRQRPQTTKKITFQNHRSPTDCQIVWGVKRNIHWGNVLCSKINAHRESKTSCRQQSCSTCFNANHFFRQCPQLRNCTKEGCESTHNILPHQADRIFPNKNPVTKPRNPETSTCVGATNINEQLETSSGLPSVTFAEGLLQITEVELHSTATAEKVLALCHSACSHSRISARLANRLKVQGVPTEFTVHGINSHQVVSREIVELKLTPVHSGGSCSPFPFKPYARENQNVGTDTIDVNYLKTKYPHLEPISLQKYRYTDVDIILDQDVFHFVRPLEYFNSDRKSTPLAVRIQLGWVLIYSINLFHQLLDFIRHVSRLFQLTKTSIQN